MAKITFKQLDTFHARHWKNTNPTRSAVSELKTIYINDLHLAMYDIDAFRNAMSQLTKQDGSPYSENGKKNFLQALNKVQRNLTDEEMFDMALILFENDVNVLNVLNGNEPMIEKIAFLKAKLEPFYVENAGNRKNALGPNMSRTSLTQEEKKNWINLKDLYQFLFKYIEDVIDPIIGKPASIITVDERKYLYFAILLAIGIVLKNTVRGDAAKFVIKSNSKEDNYIDQEKKQIVIQSGNKTHNAYSVPIPESVWKLFKCCIELSSLGTSNLLFAPIRGDGKKRESSDFYRTYFEKISRQHLNGRYVNINLIRKIVATSDYQRWKHLGCDPNTLVDIAQRLDHSLVVHLKKYVHMEMIDKDDNFEWQRFDEPLIVEDDNYV